jgi:hypothetical protein
MINYRAISYYDEGAKCFYAGIDYPNLAHKTAVTGLILLLCFISIMHLIFVPSSSSTEQFQEKETAGVIISRRTDSLPQILRCCDVTSLIDKLFINILYSISTFG